MNRNIGLIMILSCLITACSEGEKTYKVAARKLNEAVYASGKIMPAEYDVIASIFPEQILSVEVQEGDRVQKGQPLAILGAPSQHDRFQVLQQQVALARSQASDGSAVLHALRNKIDLAKQQYEQDRLNATRYAELAVDTAVSQQAADEARLKADASHTEWQNLQQQFTSQQNQLNGELLQARNALETYQEQRFQRVLSSSMDGEIISVNLQPGEAVQAGAPIMLVGSPQTHKLELLVDERDISRIALDQTVLFETDAYAGQQFEARITKINPVLEKGSRSFRIEAAVNAPSETRFYPQASVEANIVIRKQDTALMIPADYLLPGDSVWRENGDNSQKTAVVSGVRADNWVEIKDGLKAGDIIVQQP